MTAPVTGTPARAIELWFFRDLSDEQRRALIGLALGKGCADEATNHSWQRLCLRRILATHRTAAEASSGPVVACLMHALDLAKREIENLGALPEDIERALQRINLAAFPPASAAIAKAEGGAA
ncbi:hypothetical protein J3454_14230 [Erythrobacter sp. NFXS35]|uniref:hypothetical protein n=1 Tax=Erythrobacter sp. NFXS35 TaxID=2818436 RepID=UPI0032E0447A